MLCAQHEHGARLFGVAERLAFPPRTRRTRRGTLRCPGGCCPLQPVTVQRSIDERPSCHIVCFVFCFASAHLRVQYATPPRRPSARARGASGPTKRQRNAANVGVVWALYRPAARVDELPKPREWTTPPFCCTVCTACPARPSRSSTCTQTRSITHQWRATRFRLAPRTCDAPHTHVGRQHAWRAARNQDKSPPEAN